MCWSPSKATVAIPGSQVPCPAAQGPTCLEERRSPPHPALLRTPRPGSKQEGGADSEQTQEPSGTDASSLSPAWDTAWLYHCEVSMSATGVEQGRREATILAGKSSPVSFLISEGRFSETSKFQKVCLVLARLLLLPSPPMDPYTNPQPPLRCCPSPSHFRTDLLRTTETWKGLYPFYHLHLLSLSLHLTNRSLKSLFSLFSHLELPQLFSLLCSEDLL